MTLSEFMEALKGIIIIVAPLIAAYFAWRQREADLQMHGIRQDVKEVKKDAEVIKAVGNSTLREAMAATAVATQTTATVTNDKDDLIAASVAKQRLAEHDLAQDAGRKEEGRA